MPSRCSGPVALPASAFGTWSYTQVSEIPFAVPEKLAGRRRRLPGRPSSAGRRAARRPAGRPGRPARSELALNATSFPVASRPPETSERHRRVLRRPLHVVPAHPLHPDRLPDACEEGSRPLPRRRCCPRSSGRSVPSRRTSGRSRCRAGYRASARSRLAAPRVLAVHVHPDRPVLTDIADGGRRADRSVLRGRELVGRRSASSPHSRAQRLGLPTFAPSEAGVDVQSRLRIAPKRLPLCGQARPGRPFRVACEQRPPPGSRCTPPGR